MQDDKGITPSALRPGDTIAFVSPSSRLNKLFEFRISKAARYLVHEGFETVEIFSETLSKDHLESIKQRCDELHRAFRDTNIKAIVCTIGGLSANELLPHLDYELIKANPKIFCGYSDITLLHHALFTQTSLRTFYGPAAIPEFGESPKPLEFTTKHFFQMLQPQNARGPVSMSVPRSSHWTEEFCDWMSEESHQRARTLVPSPPWTWLRPGNARGRLYGGCLPSLVQLCGTKYLPDYQGRILLLETPEGDKTGVPFPLDAARTALADLRNAGVLEVVAGIVVGRPYMYDDKMNEAFQRIIIDQCYGTTFPILANVDTGHTDPMLTLPLNALVSIDSVKDQFMVEEAVVL